MVVWVSVVVTVVLLMVVALRATELVTWAPEAKVEEG